MHEEEPGKTQDDENFAETLVTTKGRDKPQWYGGNNYARRISVVGWMKVAFVVDVAGGVAGIGVTSSTPPGEGEDGRRRKRRRCTNTEWKSGAGYVA